MRAVMMIFNLIAAFYREVFSQQEVDDIQFQSTGS
jgi:hypothetical protein